MIFHDALLPYRERYESLERAPFSIQLDLIDAPIVYDFLMLDAILTHAIVTEATEGRGLPSSAEPYDLPTPLSCLWRDPIHQCPLWACSAFFPSDVQIESVFWHKRAIRPELVQGKKPLSLRTSQGADKEYRIPMPRQVSKTWRATGEGNIEEIARLLKTVGNVGKKRAYGYGRVARWEIQPLSDFSLTLPKEIALRPIPGAYFDKAPLTNYTYQGWTPPYWLTTTMCLCIPIGESVSSAGSKG